MNTIARRIAAGATLAIAPAVIVLGTATAGHADTAAAANGPSVSAPSHSAPSHSTHRWTPSTPGAPEHYLHPNRGHHYVR